MNTFLVSRLFLLPVLLTCTLLHCSVRTAPSPPPTPSTPPTPHPPQRMPPARLLLQPVPSLRRATAAGRGVCREFSSPPDGVDCVSSRRDLAVLLAGRQSGDQLQQLKQGRDKEASLDLNQRSMARPAFADSQLHSQLLPILFSLSLSCLLTPSPLLTRHSCRRRRHCSLQVLVPIPPLIPDPRLSSCQAVVTLPTRRSCRSRDKRTPPSSVAASQIPHHFHGSRVSWIRSASTSALEP